MLLHLINVVRTNGWNQVVVASAPHWRGPYKSVVDGPSTPHSNIAPLFFKMACKQNLDLRCVLISDPSTLGAGAKTRLHTPKAGTYHEQYHTL